MADVPFGTPVSPSPQAFTYTPPPPEIFGPSGTIVSGGPSEFTPQQIAATGPRFNPLGGGPPGAGGGDYLSQLVSSGQTAMATQQQRLQDYINHLYQVREMAQQAAKGLASRAQGEQNPLAVYKAVSDMSDQAGIPVDAEISKILMTDNPENTFNQILDSAAQIQSQLNMHSQALNAQQSMQQSAINAARPTQHIGGTQGQNIPIGGEPGGIRTLESTLLGENQFSSSPTGDFADNINPDFNFQSQFAQPSQTSTPSTPFVGPDVSQLGAGFAALT